VRAQPCMQGSGDAAYLLCMLCCLYLQYTLQAAVACRQGALGEGAVVVTAGEGGAKLGSFRSCL
jgi:hypothetical protein